jgi:hypothetical protein
MYESLREFNNASSDRSILLISGVVSGHNYLLEMHTYTVANKTPNFGHGTTNNEL